MVVIGNLELFPMWFFFGRRLAADFEENGFGIGHQGNGVFYAIRRKQRWRYGQPQSLPKHSIFTPLFRSSNACTFSSDMQAFGPASESLRLLEHYHSLTDDELLAIAEDTSDLTDLAQQVLSAEMSQRKLSVPAKEAALPEPEPNSEQDAEDPYAEDRSLVQIATVFSLRDAMQLQKLLDDSDVPCFMGEERATRADAVTSNFSDGVPVAVMRIGVPWAQQALQQYQPADERVTEGQQGGEDLAVHCPRCHSEDVIFEQLAAQSGSGQGEKFDWSCASCGYRWEDEGLETKN